MQIIEIKGKLLPPPEGHCRICARKHAPDAAHDATSVFFQMRFQMRYNRAGTWADAVAHLLPEQREAWRDVAEGLGVTWTEPPEGIDPISEPIDG